MRPFEDTVQLCLTKTLWKCWLKVYRSLRHIFFRVNLEVGDRRYQATLYCRSQHHFYRDSKPNLHHHTMEIWRFPPSLMQVNIERRTRIGSHTLAENGNRLLHGMHHGLLGKGLVELANARSITDGWWQLGDKSRVWLWGSRLGLLTCLSGEKFILISDWHI